MVVLLRGIMLKLLSISSKLGFLLVVVPSLNAGVFTEYVIALTYAVLISRVLSFGLEEQLVTVVKGVRKNLAMYMPLYGLSLVLVVIAILLNLVFSFENNIYLISVVLMSGSILGGLIRGVYPDQYEWILNVPWVLFLFFAFFTKVKSVYELVVILSLSHLLVHAIVVFFNKNVFSGAFSEVHRSFFNAKNIIKSSVLKVVASLLLIADFRGLLIWSKILHDNILIDSITMAISVGEGVWQLFMVLVNRKYGEYCSKKTTYYVAFQVSVKVFFGLLFSAGIVLIFSFYFESFFENYTVIDFNKIAWAIAFFGSMAALINIRNYFWADHLYEKRILLVQIFIFIVEFAIVSMADEEDWVMLSSLFIGVFTVFLSLLLLMVSGKKRDDLVTR